MNAPLDADMTQQENESSEPPLLNIDALLDDRCGLSASGEWLLTQLEIARCWAAHADDSAAAHDLAGEQEGGSLPTRWELTRTLQLWSWQRQCAQTWFDRGYQGIAKVVTGAGKTVFAQHVIERLQAEVDPELRVAIVVPTIVLMRQWVDSLRQHSNLPHHSIGCLGGGASDSFSDTIRVLVCVLNSASTGLAKRVREANVAEHLLLVVDECHRATGRTMSKVFETPRRYSLGLSATPERQGTEDVADRATPSPTGGSMETAITDELGPVIYELSVAEAVRDRILSTFEIRHYGLPLEPDERAVYDKLSRNIRDLAKTLKAAAARRRGRTPPSLFRFAQYHAQRPGSAVHVDAQQYLTAVRRRKQLLYRARARMYAVLAIVSRTLAETPQSKILLFHESIDEVMRLYDTLLRAGRRVTVDHSRLPDTLRAESISLFRSGAANILVSARALIEGFDVPSADVGIIVASSASPRQRIQTIGRVLRRPKDGSSKRALIHALYMAHTVDDAIYEKVDWNSVTGAEQNRYFQWLPPPPTLPAEKRASGVYEPVETAGPPRQPKPSELDVDWTGLKPGDSYPGKYEGDEYRCDHQGNVFDMAGRPIGNPQGVPGMIADVCSDALRFKVTPGRRAVLCWDRRSHSAKFVCFLPEPFRIATAPPAKAGAREAVGPSTRPLQFHVKPFRGQRRIWDYAGKMALVPEQASDADKGQDAVRLVEAVEAAEKRLGIAISVVMIDGTEAYCMVNGQRHRLCRLKKGLEFR